MKFAVFPSGAKRLSDAEKLSGFPDSTGVGEGVEGGGGGGGVAVRGAGSEKEPGTLL